MYYVYLKKDLTLNYRAPRVAKVCQDSLAAQSFANRISTYDEVLVLKVDDLQFNPNNFDSGIIGNNTLYHNEGILDVTFYPKKKSLGIGNTSGGIYHKPVGFFDKIYHNMGLVVRVGFFAFLVYTFISLMHAGSLSVALPYGTNTTNTFDVSVGARHIATDVYNAGLGIYHFATSHFIIQK
jgi:hypothetical protein